LLANGFGQKAEASGSLSASVNKLFAVAEDYPALQANRSFIGLQKRISELEKQIADRREFYNDAFKGFNTRIQQMPDTCVARFFWPAAKTYARGERRPKRRRHRSR
jgi:LemA protein